MISLAPNPPAADAVLTVQQRLEALFDHGTLQLVRTEPTSRRLGANGRSGDGAVAAVGRVDGRPVAAYAQDGSFAGGSLGATHADTILEALRLADRGRMPVVGLVESGGARLQEGLDALDGYARIFSAHVALSGVVPQINVVFGAACRDVPDRPGRGA